MNLLPKWALTSKNPAFYDYESSTVIEQTGKVYNAMNEMINEFNEFISKINKSILEFEKSTNKDIETFTVSLRQEFQDFINVVDLKVMSQDNNIENAVNYMKNNLSENITKLFEEYKTTDSFNNDVKNAFSDITSSIEKESEIRRKTDKEISYKQLESEKEIETLKTRVNNLTPLEGETITDTEMKVILDDLCIGADGKEYSTPAECSRTQITKLNGDVSEIANDIYNLYEISENRMHWSYDDVTEGAYLENNGTITIYEDWWISTFLEVEPSTEYVYIKNWADKSLADNIYYNLFDINKNFISGANSEVITTTPNTAYIKVSLKSSYFNGGCTLIKKDLYEQGLTTFIPYTKTFIPTKELNIVVNQLLTDVEDINTNLYELNNLVTSTEKTINTLGEYAQPNYDKNVRAIQRIGEVGNIPHHSILGFTTAYKLGFRILLCDLMFTSDNVPVCFHDESINKNYTDVQYSDGTDVPKELGIKIKEHTYEELSVYDYGSYKGEEFKGYPLLKFTDMIKLVKHLGVELYVEIKEMTEEQSIIVLDLVKSYGLEKSVTWCGNKVTTGYIKNLSDTARLGITPNELTTSTINSIVEFKTDKNEVFIFGWNTWVLTKDLVDLMKEKNIGYEIGIINTSDGINEYFEQGEVYNYCTGVESNTIIAGQILLENALK